MYEYSQAARMLTLEKGEELADAVPPSAVVDELAVPEPPAVVGSDKPTVLVAGVVSAPVCTKASDASASRKHKVFICVAKSGDFNRMLNQVENINSSRCLTVDLVSKKDEEGNA